mgnify:CR=1 FL=1
MGSFNVGFEVESNYADPDYRYIGVKVIGEVTVSSNDHDGSEQDQKYVKDITSLAIMDVLPELSRENISYRDLIMHKDRILSAVSESFTSKNITVTSFSLMNIVPDEDSGKMIEQMDKMNTISKMSPEELVKIQQEQMAAVEAMKEGATVTTFPKFCPNCGTPTGGTGKFCSSCGSRLG